MPYPLLRRKDFPMTATGARIEEIVTTPQRGSLPQWLPSSRKPRYCGAPPYICATSAISTRSSSESWRSVHDCKSPPVPLRYKASTGVKTRTSTPDTAIIRQENLSPFTNATVPTASSGTAIDPRLKLKRLKLTATPTRTKIITNPRRIGEDFTPPESIHLHHAITTANPRNGFKSIAPNPRQVELKSKK